MTLSSEEAAQIEGIDSPIVVFVDGPKGSERREVVAELKRRLQDIKAALEVDFLLKDVSQGALDAE